MKYSIVLPVYNGGDLFKLCVEKILSFKRADFRLHVLDNCSNDDSIKWLIDKNDARVEITPSDTPLTIEGNWTRIKSLKKNRYMTMIGHDDLLHDDYLETMDSLIEKYPDATLYQTHFRYINKKGDLIVHCKPMAELIDSSEFLEHQIKKSLDSTGTGYMMKSADYDELGGISPRYPSLLYADYELWIRLINKGFMATSPKECFSYRIHQSTSAVSNGQVYQLAFRKYIEFLIDFKEKISAIQKIIDTSGKQFMEESCESLSHRILKTDFDKREISVLEFVRECKRMSIRLLNGRSIHPLLNWKVLLAVALDNRPGQRLFFFVKSFQK